MGYELIGGGGGSGSVTSVSIVSANGFGGSVATSTSTPAITLTTAINGMVKGNGTALAAAVAGTDYQAVIDNTTALTVNSLTLSGNISSAAWGTNGLRLKGAHSTFTDTTSSGTVAAAYTNTWGGNTIAANSAVTFTDYFNTYIKAPVAGTNVTFTNGWSLGLEGPMKAPSVTLAMGTITTSQPAINATQTWNAAGVTFKGLFLNVTDTASAAASLLVDLQVGGSSKFNVTKGGVVTVAGSIGPTSSGGADLGAYSLGFNNVRARVVDCESGTGTTAARLDQAQGLSLGTSASMGWTASGTGGATLTTSLFQDASDVMAQRRGTNAQTLRVYNTYTDASNYERGFIQWSSNVLYFGAEIAGTGAQRAVQYDCHTSRGRAYVKGSTDGNTLYLGCQTATVLTLDGGVSGGNVGLFNTYWLGGAVVPVNFGLSASGVSNRVGDSLIIRVKGGSGNATQSYFGIGVAYPQASGTTAHGQEDALLVRLNATATTVLAFGSSFANTVPALIRSGTTLKARLADDSGDVPITVSYIRTVPVTVANLPAAATAGQGARAFVTDANATTYASTVAGGGSNKVPVYSDGTNWLIG